MTKTKKKKTRPNPLAHLPTHVDWNALHQTAAILEKAKLADYMDLLSHPWRNIRVNFIAGLARGAGIVVGGTIVGALLIFTLLSGLKTAFHHAGGLPVVGEQLKEGIGWVLDAVHEHQDGG